MSMSLSLRPVLVGLVLATCAAGGAQAQSLLPTGFFDRLSQRSSGPAAIEADMLSYDADANIIRAEGDVVLRYNGYEAHGDSLVFNQRTEEVRFIGNVRIIDATGAVFETNDLEVTGGMKEAFLQSLTLTMPDGSMVSATDVDYSASLKTILTQASYSPCGLCIDSKGRSIGWRVRAARMIYNSESKIVELEQPSLELLNFPVAWLPYLSFPDPTQERSNGFLMPSVDYGDATGVKLTVPYMWALNKDTELIFRPSAMSRQGLMLGGDWIQRFRNGSFDVRASGIYQLDRGAFAGKVGDLDWRWAVQSAGEFTPVENWKTGWSFTALSDAAYLGDYRLDTAKSSVNEVYATYLDRVHYGDVRFQHFNLLGNVTEAQQDQQGMALPNARHDSVFELGEDLGRVEVTTRLLGVHREADQATSYNGVPYVFGYKENKVHGMVQAGWQRRWVAPGGFVATPYLGLRGDAAYYDGSSPLLPGEVSLFTATPIAALDVRWPLIAYNGADAHTVEPITQLVYRGSSTTAPGITNDDAQSFVFEDTNLFSYNRFTGADRQETGLRANAGLRYQANFASGAWLELLAGQSFHLAGVNGLGVPDAAQTGNSTGLGGTASYIVFGAKGSLIEDLELAAKLQLDPMGGRATRAGLSASYTIADYTFGLDYLYMGSTPALGILKDQHEVAGTVGIPFQDYWRFTVGGAWDLAQNSWLEATGGVMYDDGYLAYGGSVFANGPTHSSPNNWGFKTTFRIKGPGGIDFGY